MMSTANDNVSKCQDIVNAKHSEHQKIREKLLKIAQEDKEKKASLDAAMRDLQHARNDRANAEQEHDNYVLSSSAPPPSTPRRAGLRQRNNNQATQMNNTLSIGLDQ